MHEPHLKGNSNPGLAPTVGGRSLRLRAPTSGIWVWAIWALLAGAAPVDVTARSPNPGNAWNGADLAIEELGITKQTGDCIPLLYVDRDVYVGLEPLGEKEHLLAAFPRWDRKGNPTGWVTDHQQLVFARTVRSVAGRYSWKGTNPAVVGADANGRLLIRWNRNGDWIKVWVPASWRVFAESTRKRSGAPRETDPIESSVGLVSQRSSNPAARQTTPGAAASRTSVPTRVPDHEPEAVRRRSEWWGPTTKIGAQQFIERLSAAHISLAHDAGLDTGEAASWTDRVAGSTSPLTLAAISGVGTMVFALALVAVQRHRGFTWVTASTHALTRQHEAKREKRNYIDRIEMMTSPPSPAPESLATKSTGSRPVCLPAELTPPPRLEAKAGDFARVLGGIADGPLLLEVVQMLHLCRKTGVLRLGEPNVESVGMLTMVQGEIINAKAGAGSGREALTRFFNQQCVQFTFQQDPNIDPTRQFAEGTMELLLGVMTSCG